MLLVTMLMSINIKINYADDIDEEENENIDVSIVSNNLNEKPTINSRRYVIYDRNAKRILYGKNEKVKSAMASTTKIMTAIIVLENDDLNKVATISPKAARTGGSRLGLKKDDKISIRDLLYGLLMRSGNDAAVALAIETAGSVEEFANLMNNKANELGLSSTHFVTPHGLDNPEHYTTAFELAKLTDYALENNIFASIVGTKNYTITINGYSKQLNNTNELLGVLNGVIGVKTGFTNNAGRCLVTETKRGNKDIITVVLGADTKKDRTRDSVKLIDYAYNNFQEFNIEEKAIETFENWENINGNRIKVEKGKNEKLKFKLSEIKNKKILIDKNDISDITYEINSISKIKAPVEDQMQVRYINNKII